MIELFIGISIIFSFVIIIFIMLILSQKKRHKKKYLKVEAARAYLFKKYFDHEEVELPVSKRFFFDALIDIDEQIHLEPEIREKIIDDLCDSKFIIKQKKRLNALQSYKRIMASYYISKLRTEQAYELLFNRFIKEKSEAVRLRIVADLRYGLTDLYVKTILESLVDASDRYHHEVCMLLGSNYKRIYESIVAYEHDQRYEVILALVKIASFHADAFLIAYMENILSLIVSEKPFSQDHNQIIKDQILKNMIKYTPELLINETYLQHTDLDIKSSAISALVSNPSIASINDLIESLDQSELDEVRVNTLSKIILAEAFYIDHVLRIFDTLNAYQKQKVTIVLSNRIEYIILNLFDKQNVRLEHILTYMLNQSIIEPIIDFLNINSNQLISTFIIHIIKQKISSDEKMLKEFRLYLNIDVLNLMGLQKLKVPLEVREKAPKEKRKIIWMIKWITLSMMLFPIIFVLTRYQDIQSMTFIEIIRSYIIDVNIYLIYYFGVINVIYITLFMFALRASKKQVDLYSTKKNTLLFSDRLLPGISIIAPAYNEEISIIDSVTSLLNLKYPIYEVIVVNDGSKDLTLQKLIEHFHLERKHPTHINALSTKSIRGIYKTKEIPNLVVVDKQNGGKADALNVGINVSKHPYVCGIDADSILEGDALLKLASAMLDDTKPHIALGGNIYPANGFTIDKGKVEKRGIPKEIISRFQTIEYLRAFTSGRIGWSELKSLMIISGAFGLFQKDALIETGGYLTSSSKLKKDTVGEDMELVVRLTRQAIEHKDPYRVKYVYNAYCYTELPSDLKTLLKQRNRWQRGLIDILSYHRKLGFNFKYKQIGLLGYPYFFIFEFLGPFFETQGYIMLLIALILGLLNPGIILAIFSLSILFGVVISLSSLFMTEKDKLMMSHKDTFILIIYAIIENFGYRQMISLHRVLSSFSALKESGQWGAQKRKGFKI